MMMTRNFWTLNLVLVSCVLLVGLPILTQAAVDEDTVALWLFDEGSGEIVKDSSGNGHDGKFVGEIKRVQGKWGKALDFDGTDGIYVEVPHAEDLSLAEWSIEAWLNVRSVVGGWHCPFGKEGIDPTTRNYALYIQGGDLGIAHGSISVGNAMGHATFGATNIIDGEWHHIAATYDGNKCTLYIDGQEDFGRSVGGDADGEIGGPPDFDETPITIGNIMSGARSVDAVMDEIHLSKRARTVDEIMESMKGLAGDAAAVYPSGKLTTTWANIKQ